MGDVATLKHLRAILLLPVMITVVIPGTVLFITGFDTLDLWQTESLERTTYERLVEERVLLEAPRGDSALDLLTSEAVRLKGLVVSNRVEDGILPHDLLQKWSEERVARFTVDATGVSIFGQVIAL